MTLCPTLTQAIAQTVPTGPTLHVDYHRLNNTNLSARRHVVSSAHRHASHTFYSSVSRQIKNKGLTSRRHDTVKLQDKYKHVVVTPLAIYGNFWRNGNFWHFLQLWQFGNFWQFIAFLWQFIAIFWQLIAIFVNLMHFRTWFNLIVATCQFWPPGPPSEKLPAAFFFYKMAIFTTFTISFAIYCIFLAI